nr:hypothetical protein Iba_scaffold19491CG0090 [Ipomoea batatas]
MGKINFLNVIIDAEDPGVLESVQNLPMCSNKQPPGDECRKQILTIIQQGLITIPWELPSSICCSQLQRWGNDCIAKWMVRMVYDNAKDYMMLADSIIIIENMKRTWEECQ